MRHPTEEIVQTWTSLGHNGENRESPEFLYIYRIFFPYVPKHAIFSSKPHLAETLKMSKDRSGKNNAIIIIRCDLFPFLFFSFFVVASRPRSRHARKFAKDRSMVRPGNGSFTGKPTVFTRFWLGIHREF